MTAKPSETPTDQYLIMDGRAFNDIDNATVLEACGTKCPSRKYVKREWPEDSVVVRWSGWNGKAFTKQEIVWEATPWAQK